MTKSKSTLNLTNNTMNEVTTMGNLQISPNHKKILSSISGSSNKKKSNANKKYKNYNNNNVKTMLNDIKNMNTDISSKFNIIEQKYNSKNDNKNLYAIIGQINSMSENTQNIINDSDNFKINNYDSGMYNEKKNKNLINLKNLNKSSIHLRVSTVVEELDKTKNGSKVKSKLSKKSECLQNYVNFNSSQISRNNTNSNNNNNTKKEKEKEIINNNNANLENKSMHSIVVNRNNKLPINHQPQKHISTVLKDIPRPKDQQQESNFIFDYKKKINNKDNNNSNSNSKNNNLLKKNKANTNTKRSFIADVKKNSNKHASERNKSLLCRMSNINKSKNTCIKNIVNKNINNNINIIKNIKNDDNDENTTIDVDKKCETVSELDKSFKGDEIKVQNLMTANSCKENKFIYNKDLMLNSYDILNKKRGNKKTDYKLKKMSKEKRNNYLK